MPLAAPVPPTEEAICGEAVAADVTSEVPVGSRRADVTSEVPPGSRSADVTIDVPPCSRRGEAPIDSRAATEGGPAVACTGTACACKTRGMDLPLFCAWPPGGALAETPGDTEPKTCSAFLSAPGIGRRYSPD
jgi:hypothetical protein